MEEINVVMNTWQYAQANNINPIDPTTWDDEYRKRQQGLAGLTPIAKKQVALFKEWLDSIPKSDETEKEE